MANVLIKFKDIHVNRRNENYEVIFKYGNKWYRLDWEYVPEKYKILYVAKLKLLGYEISDELKNYERDTIDISDLNIEIDLSNAQEVPEIYPLGV